MVHERYRPEVRLDRRDDRQVGVAGLLQLRDESEYVVHLELPLLRLQAAAAGVGDVDKHQVGQVEACTVHIA